MYPPANRTPLEYPPSAISPISSTRSLCRHRRSSFGRSSSVVVLSVVSRQSVVSRLSCRVVSSSSVDCRQLSSVVSRLSSCCRVVVVVVSCRVGCLGATAATAVDERRVAGAQARGYVLLPAYRCASLPLLVGNPLHWNPLFDAQCATNTTAGYTPARAATRLADLDGLIPQTRARPPQMEGREDRYKRVVNGSQGPKESG
ncbi:hypothetical protein BO78DRAFT_394039 [Aspergillus sclerotiicarbonarius CBS 121057]|uniref:Uncharacterized protein n=1 Tax=Aspergillus sclerotiicarbonarius (strain CBS 121057 / IBT 28362) TaxID=1448318 RepID=A0A319EK23_ASPSB|nr:hypothetical protein BO78DRAFT_394039 [Aspergillus sclerotiicarbonarius CBS 121057]